MATVNPLLQQIDAIAKEKGVEPDIIITALQDAIEAAARKRYKTEALRARFNQESGQLELFASAASSSVASNTRSFSE